MKYERGTIDIPGILDYLTNIDGWADVPGPETGSGLDYFYQVVGPKDIVEHDAYVNIDQDMLSITVDDEPIYGPQDYTEDEALSQFWTVQDVDTSEGKADASTD